MATYPTVELKVGSTWTDITTYVRYQDMIEIKRGRSAEASQFDTSTCSMTLDNRDGRFSPRNPTGAYYGSIGRNTPIRVSLDGGLPYLNLPGASGDRSSTPDAAALDITGDIDVRVEMFLLDWNVPSGQEYEIIGKYNATGNQRSWAFSLAEGGLPTLTWSNDGSTILTATATAAMANDGRSRVAIRVTLDVDNGAGGKTATFYTADSITGTWTQLGSTVTTAATTSIFSSTADLHIGDISTLNLNPMPGRVYVAKVLNGIAGTEVANPDFTAQTVGASSFTDAAGRTWTQEGNATISNRKLRFMGEVSAWPVDWDISGTDVVTKIEASGIIRRLTQGDAPLRSSLFREMTNPERLNILAYWPMEDASGSDSFASGIAGHPVMTYTGTPNFASSEAWSGSDKLPAIDDGILTAQIPSYTTTGETSTFFLLNVPSGGVSASTLLISLKGTGTVKKWEIRLSTTGQLTLLAYDLLNTELLGLAPVNFGLNGDLSRVVFELTQNGVDIDYRISVADYTLATTINSATPGSSTTGTLTGNTVGRITTAIIGDGGLGETTVGHLALADDLSAYGSTSNAIIGHRDENPSNRLRRLVQNEEDIPLQIHTRAASGNTVTMGVQDPEGLVSLVREIGDADMGILYEPRDEIAIAYRTRLSIYNQTARLALNYASNQLSAAPIPVDDDRYVRNDVTVSREHGSFSNATLDTGTLSILPPPNGVGRYEEDVTISLGADSQLADQAGWRLFLGTVDEARYPQISLNLRHSTFTGSTTLMENALELEIGDVITISNPPSWIPPDQIELVAVGFSERLGILERDIVVNCIPGSPYHVATVEGSDYERADTAGTTTTEDLTTTETDVDVLTTIGSAPWITTADFASEFPFDVRCGGEVMTVTACTHGLSDDFSTNQTDSWGTADVGGTWVNSGGDAGDYDVAGGVGTHLLTTTSTSRRSTLTAPSASFDIYCDIATDQLATGASLFGNIMARVVDASNLYQARLEFTTTNTIILSIRERAAAVESTLGTAVTLRLTHVAGTYYRVRFQGSGTALRAKAWLTTDLEPGPWQVDTTDATLTAAGSIGCRSISDTGNTNVNPIVSYDNFKLINPQVMTVTRSVNGVVKTHSSGADIRLAHPSIISL